MGTGKILSHLRPIHKRLPVLNELRGFSLEQFMAFDKEPHGRLRRLKSDMRHARQHGRKQQPLFVALVLWRMDREKFKQLFPLRERREALKHAALLGVRKEAFQSFAAL